MPKNKNNDDCGGGRRFNRFAFTQIREARQDNDEQHTDKRNDGDAGRRQYADRAGDRDNGERSRTQIFLSPLAFESHQDTDADGDSQLDRDFNWWDA